jgi:hypothetical protein
MNRADLQQLVRDRVRDARVLLAGRRWSAAYYLLGYAVECGLKSCVIKYLMATDAFPERRYSEQCWTHNLDQLMTLAGLKPALDASIAADPELASNWDTAKDWTEATRYARTSKAKAVRLYRAVTGAKHGILAWLKTYW